MIIFRKLTALLRVVAAAVVLSSAIPLAAQTALITSSDQITGFNNLTDRFIDPIVIDEDLEKEKNPQSTIDINTPFIIELSSAVELSPQKGLVVYTARYDKGGNPTVIKVEASSDGSSYEDLGYAYFLYRGEKTTHEYSDKIKPKETKSYQHFKFTVLEVANGNVGDNKNQARMFKFNLYAIADGENYPNGRIDPIRLADDYFKDYWDYTFQNSSGILEPRNHYGVNAGYPTETPWGDNNTFEYDGETHELPTFHKQGGGQMPHISEVTLYAMPGDVIPLIPFYDLPRVDNYRETFSHWYGYIPKTEQTGDLLEQDYHHILDNGNNRLLDFLVDPAGIFITEKAGYFGGSAFPRYFGKFVIRTADDLEEFSRMVVQGGGYEYLDAVLDADIDCSGRSFMIGGWNGDLQAQVQYKGIFDGNGHTIRNYSRIGNGSNYYEGLFAFIGAGCIIKDLLLENVYVSTGGRAGGLVGGVGGSDGHATIQNVLVKGDVRLVGNADSGGNVLSYAGGIVGIVANSCSLTLDNVGFIGTVDGGYGNQYSNGALIGRIEYGGDANQIINCYADATVGYVCNNGGMYYSTKPIQIENSYMNVRSYDRVPGLERTYNIYQEGFTNVYPFSVTPEDRNTAGSKANKIYVLKEAPDDDYLLIMNDASNGLYTATTDETEIRDGKNYIVFTIPNEFKKNPDTRYTVVPYKKESANKELSPLLNVLPHKETGRNRLIVKKPENWESLFVYEWPNNNWPGQGPSGTMKFDDIEYQYFDLSSNLSTTEWGITFTNGKGENDGQIKYPDVLHNIDGDMKVELTQISAEPNEDHSVEGHIMGAYFNPLFFEYNPSQAAPEIIIGDVTYKAGVLEINNTKYWYINLAPELEEATGYETETTRFDRTLISKENVPDIGEIFANVYGITADPLFFTELPSEEDPVVEFSHTERNFYEAVLSEERWISHDGIPYPILPDPVKIEYDTEVRNNLSHATRWYGTAATFYQPLKTNVSRDDNSNLHLDFPKGRDTFHVAADFAHEFNPIAEEVSNVEINDEGDKIIHEPVINFRYIFHIKDGATFAEENTATSEANLDYLDKNSRTVSARVGHDFQIRINTLVPATNGDIHYTNFYYKRGENDYARVPRVELEIEKMDDDGKWVKDEYIPEGSTTAINRFGFEAKSASLGSRNYPDNGGKHAYQIGDGDNSIYRVIYCPNDATEEGTFRVRLVASDGQNRIKTYEGGKDIYLEEFIITFMPEQSASVLTEQQLATEEYRTHRASYLEDEDVAGAPAVVVNFDQYRTFESEEYKASDYFTFHNEKEPNHRAYKWPMLWQKSSYSFGYGGYYNYDYNEYLIANHSDQVMYKASAEKHVNSDQDGSSGLYDRLWYDTYDKETGTANSGYFYYVNAASDPGIIAKLNINDICPGSTVVVSAWAAEMSNRFATANISFNFMAVDEDGNSETIHTFVTGFIDNQKFGTVERRSKGEDNDGNINTNHGEWMHIYYSFMPELSSVRTLKNVDHYELWLENNCVSSDGADYAVDDIRAYIIQPTITAKQLNPVCDPDQKHIGIQISSPFENVLESNGLEMATSEDEAKRLKMYFAVLDKNKYDKVIAEGGESEEAVRQSIIKVANSTTGESTEDIYTEIHFSTFYRGMELYKENVFGEAMREENNTARNGNVMTNILPYDTDLRAGKDYYIVLQTMYEDADYEPSAADFIIDGQCAKFTTLTLQGSGVIKIDGVAVNDGEPVDVCLGQSPVVQVDLKMYKGGTTTDVTKDFEDAGDHYYDWYLGSVEDFISTEEHEQSYYSLLQSFREDDKDSTELPEDEKYDDLRDLVSNGQLVLHASSFVFPPVKDTENHLIVLTAMPIIPGPYDDNTYVVCSQPSEIRLRVQNSAPLMHDGFEGIPYKEGIVDVPFRVGLNQLRSVSYQNIAQTDGIGKYLELPLRNLTSYQATSTSVKMYGDITTEIEENSEWDPFVYLVETNDPLYIGLNKHPEDKEEVEGLLPIGLIAELSAEKNGEDITNDNLVKLVFSNEMKFREGYYYRVRFSYNEEVDNNAEGYCLGHVVFTLKVVPEYMKWTGADSRNWNNDANWSRVTDDELLLPAGDGKIKDHTIAKANDNRLSYAPLDFTKVVVPDLRKEYVDATAEKPVMKPTEGYPWMFDASVYEGGIATLNDKQPWNDKAVSDEQSEGVASENIEYDMTSLDLSENNKLACRPWYANTCEQIHFNHGAELLHQESFVFDKNYKKAWVDMEMAADRWYTLGSPLQGVVAGDMYTKSKGGKQDNELFTDIEFNTDDYGRYAPAVYQRGWNKSEANTYFLGDGTHDSKSAAVELNWSRVYNDVEEVYAPGTGFSIRTDSKTISEWDEDVVRFRLPKADNNYSYFDPTNQTEEADDTKVERNGERHSLVAFTKGKFEANVTVGKDGSYFLVGNPFIASMDMGKFLKENEKVIEQAYWIMTDERQEATLWDEKSGTFLGTDETEKVDGVIAPMQGFFVKAKTQATALTLTFTPEMIVTDKVENAPLLRSEERYQPQVIRVSALNVDGDVASRALINIDPIAQADYVGSEDAALLIDRTLDNRATVYTVASEQALAINSLDAIVETEVGLLATEGTRSTLMFEGIDDSEGLLLLDTADGSVTDLYNGMTVDVEGSASGRFYITRPAEGLTELALAVVIADRTVSVVSGVEGITARVYTPAGLCVGEWSSDDTSLQFDLESGIFIVEAVSENQRVTRKFVVK